MGLPYQNSDDSSTLEFFSKDPNHTGENHRREEPPGDNLKPAEPEQRAN